MNYRDKEKGKPHLTLITVGPSAHGKTTLTSAITKTLALTDDAVYVSVSSIIENAKYEGRHSHTGFDYVQYLTDKRGYIQYDYLTQDYLNKNLLYDTAVYNQALTDGLILVIAAPEGVTAEIYKQLVWVRQVN